MKPYRTPTSERFAPVRANCAHCAHCAHFDARAEHIEAQFAGLASLSSAYASVRGNDGFCSRHQRLLGAASSCAEFAVRTYQKSH